MVTWLAVIPGADAVLDVDVGVELPQAAVSSAAAPPAAATAKVLDLLISGRMPVLLVCMDSDCGVIETGTRCGRQGSGAATRTRDPNGAADDGCDPSGDSAREHEDRHG